MFLYERNGRSMARTTRHFLMVEKYALEKQPASAAITSPPQRAAPNSSWRTTFRRMENLRWRRF